MDKKAINEVRRLFDKNNCRIDRMYGCYVSENKEKITELKDTLHSLEDEELFKYCELFKKVVSGRIGRTLFNVDFPLKEEREGGHQAYLYRLLKSGLKDETLVSDFFDRVIESYRSSEKYLILLVHGSYDVPGRTRDGIGLSDASEEVYHFLELSICPVLLLRDGLCYDAAEKAFFSRTEDWSVQKPETGLLYPAFNERSSDIHAALWYAKNEKARHDELAEALLGTELPRAETAEKDAFRAVLEAALGEQCDYETVKNMNEAVVQIAEAGKDAEEPAVVDHAELRRIFYDNGVDEEAIARLDLAYDEIIGAETQPLLAENIAERKKLSVKSDHLSMEIAPESAAVIETRVIDGTEYFLIPVRDNVTVNGVRIRSKA